MDLLWGNTWFHAVNSPSRMPIASPTSLSNTQSFLGEIAACTWALGPWAFHHPEIATLVAQATDALTSFALQVLFSIMVYLYDCPLMHF